jgi:hypothetical protein
MKKFLLAAIVLVMLGSTAKAQVDGFGLGLIFGNPTGISAKYFMNEKNAIDGALAWSLNGDWMQIHADYLWHFYVIDVSKGEMPFYVGAGAKFGIGDDFHLGVRVPLGIAYHFENAPLDIFLEIVPGMDLTPDTDFELDGGIGIRYYF